MQIGSDNSTNSPSAATGTSSSSTTPPPHGSGLGNTVKRERVSQNRITRAITWWMNKSKTYNNHFYLILFLI